jgi:hypothetical protein
MVSAATPFDPICKASSTEKGLFSAVAGHGHGGQGEEEKG